MWWMLELFLSFGWFLSLFTAVLLLFSRKDAAVGILLFFLSKSVFLLIKYFQIKSGGFTGVELNLLTLLSYPLVGICYYICVIQIMKRSFPKVDLALGVIFLSVFFLLVTSWCSYIPYSIMLLLASLILILLLARGGYLVMNSCKRFSKCSVESMYFICIAALITILIIVNTADCFYDFLPRYILFYILVGYFTFDVIFSFFILFKDSYNSSFTDFVANDAAQKSRSELRNMIISLKLYRDTELTSASFAQEIGRTRAAVLSEFGHSEAVFDDFIARVRIQEFKQLAILPESRKKSLTILANQCGFNSRSTFNRTFKKYEKKTPTDYIKEKYDGNTNITI